MRPPSTHSSPKMKTATSRQNSTHSKKRVANPTLLSINALSDGNQEVSDVIERQKKSKMESYRTEKRKLFSLKYEDTELLSLGYDSSKEGFKKHRKVKTGRDLEPLEDPHESHLSEERKLSLTSHSLLRDRGSGAPKSRKQSTEERKKSKFSSQRHGSGDFQVQPSQLGAQNKLVPLAVSGSREHGKSAGTLGENMAIQRMLLTQQIGQKKQGEVKKRAMKGQPGQKRIESQRDFIIRKTHLHH